MRNERWRDVPIFAKLLILSSVANTLMLIYNTDFIYHLNLIFHVIGS
jgi:hypothetical protein